MPKPFTRRDLLKLAGGSALGVLMTPLPWKLLDDSAIWTQNWSLIPPLPRGPESWRFSACTLCPGGCPVKARCIGGLPVSLTGVAGHPVGDGFLCPIGLAGHHMAFHPDRIFRPWMRVRGEGGYTWRPSLEQEVLDEIARHRRNGGTGKPFGVLDRRPGRCASLVYGEFLRRSGGGKYILSHHREEGMLGEVRRRISPDPGPLGYDLERAAVVLSFGAPLLDGWGAPGRMRKIFDRNGAAPSLIHVGSRLSGTASRADLRVPVRPGTEADLAAGIGRLLIEENLCRPGVLQSVPDIEAYRRMVREHTPELVASRTGIDPALVAIIARRIGGPGPAVVIDGSDPAGGPPDRRTRDAIVALNILAGSVNRQGGILPRNIHADGVAEHLDEAELCDVPDGSLGLLIIDDAESGLALPESAIRRIVDPESGVIIAFSPYLAGAALAADVVIPVPAPYESLTEAVSPATDPRAAIGLAAPLLAPRIMGGVVESMLDRIGALSGDRWEPLPRTASIIDRRLGTLCDAGRGSVARPVTGGEAATEKLSSPEELRSAMTGGAWWISADPEPGRHTLSRILPGQESTRAIASTPVPADDGHALTLVPNGWRGAVGSMAIPPVASKIFRESELRYPGGHAALNPATAVSAGLRDGARARIVTRNGSVEVKIHCDEAVMPGVIALECGPVAAGSGTAADPLSLCETGPDGSWRTTSASLEVA